MRNPAAISSSRKALAKSVRARLRLRYSLECDEELNTVLPYALEAFDDYVLSGKLPKLEVLLAELDIR